MECFTFWHFGGSPSPGLERTAPPVEAPGHFLRRHFESSPVLQNSDEQQFKHAITAHCRGEVPQEVPQEGSMSLWKEIKTYLRKPGWKRLPLRTTKQVRLIKRSRVKWLKKKNLEYINMETLLLWIYRLWSGETASKLTASCWLSIMDRTRRNWQDTLWWHRGGSLLVTFNRNCKISCLVAKWRGGGFVSPPSV